MKDDYSKLKERAGHLGEWLNFSANQPWKAEIQEEVVIDDHKFNRGRGLLPYYHGSLE